jgi:hypothetical protein
MPYIVLTKPPCTPSKSVTCGRVIFGQRCRLHVHATWHLFLAAGPPAMQQQQRAAAASHVSVESVGCVPLDLPTQYMSARQHTLAGFEGSILLITVGYACGGAGAAIHIMWEVCHRCMRVAQSSGMLVCCGSSRYSCSNACHAFHGGSACVHAWLACKAHSSQMCASAHYGS